MFFSVDMSDQIQVKPVNEADLKDLKERMKLISEADPSQYHNELSLKRYLRAFKTTDAAFQVFILDVYYVVLVCVEKYKNILVYI